MSGVKTLVEYWKGQKEKFLKAHEEFYLMARLGKGVFRDGFSETVKRYRVFRYEQIIWKDPEDKPLLLYSEREKLIANNPAREHFCLIGFFRDAPEQDVEPFVNSVLVQPYENWELVLLDLSDAAHSETSRALRKNAKRSRRIHYRRVNPSASLPDVFAACCRKHEADYYLYLDQAYLLIPTAMETLSRCIQKDHPDLVYSDEASIRESWQEVTRPLYKPDYAPDTLRSYNYIGSFYAFHRDISSPAFQQLQEKSQDPSYDLILSLTEKARKIVHIPETICYYKNESENACGHLWENRITEKDDLIALGAHLLRKGLSGTVKQGLLPNTYQIHYRINGSPLISILIPNKDHVEDLKTCIDSIREKTTWKNWEIVIIENNSQKPETWEYYRELDQDPRIRIAAWNDRFNFSRICNYGAGFARGEYLLLLNNDTEVISPDWIEQMLMFAQREDVGAVGVKLLYRNNTIQHAGVIIDPVYNSFHYLRNVPEENPGYAMRLSTVQNLSACTGACLLVKTAHWESVKGLDEQFEVSYNDIDFCLKLRSEGLLIVWTPYAKLYHHELKSRGDNDTPEKIALAQREAKMFREKWNEIVETGDPYYNLHLKGDMLMYPNEQGSRGRM